MTENNDRFLFRAWDKVNDSMLYKFDVHSDDGAIENVHLPPGTVWEGRVMWDKEDFVLMQCTSGKDKYNKLIFEGDIIEAILPFENKKMKGTVIYHDPFEGYGIETKKFIYRLSETAVGQREIIGNVYENKNLPERKE